MNIESGKEKKRQKEDVLVGLAGTVIIQNKPCEAVFNKYVINILCCLVFFSRVHVNIMPRRKDRSSDPRGATAAVHKSGKFGVHHFTTRKLIYKWKTFKTVVNNDQ